MKRKDDWEIEFIPIPIPRNDYDEKMAQLVEALLATLENEPEQAEDVQVLGQQEVA